MMCLIWASKPLQDHSRGPADRHAKTSRLILLGWALDVEAISLGEPVESKCIVYMYSIIPILYIHIYNVFSLSLARLLHLYSYHIYHVSRASFKWTTIAGASDFGQFDKRPSNTRLLLPRTRALCEVSSQNEAEAGTRAVPAGSSEVGQMSEAAKRRRGQGSAEYTRWVGWVTT